jgi:hypothetical protein
MVIVMDFNPETSKLCTIGDLRVHLRYLKVDFWVSYGSGCGRDRRKSAQDWRSAQSEAIGSVSDDR